MVLPSLVLSPHPEPQAWMLTRTQAGAHMHQQAVSSCSAFPRKHIHLWPLPSHSLVLKRPKFSCLLPRKPQGRQGSTGRGLWREPWGQESLHPKLCPGRGWGCTAEPALETGDALGLPVSTVVPLEGVLGQDRPSLFFFLSFLYPEKTDFHRDLGLAAASSRVPGLGLSRGRPSPLGFFSFLLLRGEKRDDLFLLFPLEPSDEVTEPSGPPESEGGDSTSSLVASCLGAGSSGPWGGTAVALRGAGVLGAAAAMSISFILLSCRAMASLSACRESPAEGKPPGLRASLSAPGLTVMRH